MLGGGDNWLVQYIPPGDEPNISDSVPNSSNPIDEIQVRNDKCSNKSIYINGGHPQTVQIAAIDNGLAFPTHHPNRIRSYPVYCFVFNDF